MCVVSIPDSSITGVRSCWTSCGLLDYYCALLCMCAATAAVARACVCLLVENSGNGESNTLYFRVTGLADPRVWMVCASSAWWELVRTCVRARVSSDSKQVEGAWFPLAQISFPVISHVAVGKKRITGSCAAPAYRHHACETSPSS